jgi:hypothetical protein
MGRFPIQGVLSKCLNAFIVPEITSKYEGARDHNPLNEELLIGK